MSFALTLTKPGETPPAKFSLNLAKPETFFVKVKWNSRHDLDAHALLCFNNGVDGAKVQEQGNILSTYNAVKTNPAGILATNANGSFSTPNGSATHSGDARTGDALPEGEDDETITINGTKIPRDVNEIPLFITIHPASSATFSEVEKAEVVIENATGKILAHFHLTNEFAAFDAVQMGSLILDANGWSFSPAAVGFNGDFNEILGFFS